MYSARRSDYNCMSFIWKWICGIHLSKQTSLYFSNNYASNQFYVMHEIVKSPLIERATGQYKNLQNQTHRHQGDIIFPNVEKVKKQRKEIFVTTRISIPTPPGTAASSIIPVRNWGYTLEKNLLTTLHPEYEGGASYTSLNRITNISVNVIRRNLVGCKSIIHKKTKWFRCRYNLG